MSTNPVPSPVNNTGKTGPAASTSASPSTPTTMGAGSSTPHAAPGSPQHPSNSAPGTVHASPGSPPTSGSGVTPSPHVPPEKVDDPAKPPETPAVPSLATGAVPPAPAPAGHSDVPVNDVHVNIPMPGHKIGITYDGFNPLNKLVYVGDILEFHNHEDVERRVSFNNDVPDIVIPPKTMKRVNVEKSGRFFALSNGKQAEFQVLHSRK